MKQEPKTNFSSRKYLLTLLIFVTATLLCGVPPILSVFVFKQAALVVLTGTEWVSVVTLICAGYFGANVVQKKWLIGVGQEDGDEPPEEIDGVKPKEEEKK